MKCSKKSLFDKIKYLFLMFMIGAFIGWIYEEIYFLIDDHILTYRGAMWGPYLPVYGVGAIVIYLTLFKYKKHPSIIFFGSVLLTGIVEYITGWICHNLYHTRLWDYTGDFMNIQGFVCLRSVLLFGILALLFVYLVEPMLTNFIKNSSIKKQNIVFYILVSIFILDLIIGLFIPNTLGVV